MTESLYVPSSAPWSYRALVMGSLQPAYYTSSDDDRRREILPAMKRLFEQWETLGRLIGSFDDDLFVAGPPASADFSIYLLFEVDTPDAVVQMLQLIRDTVDGVRLDQYFRFEARLGRALFLASDFAR